MELLIIFFVAIGFNVVSFWAIARIKDNQLLITKRIWDRLNYLEMAISYHDMIPLPWEIEEMNNNHKKDNKFKKEGNVVYIGEEE